MGIATSTAKALEEIVTGITKVTDMVGEIESASIEQTQGIEQISEGLNQVDQVTQSNTATAEESASASEELSSLAVRLKQMIAKFQLKGQAIGTQRRLVSRPEKEVKDNFHSSRIKKSTSDSLNLEEDDFGDF